ncbi:MAG: hypothetical protein ACFFDC_11965 [Promethearchaeota archaeon]
MNNFKKKIIVTLIVLTLFCTYLPLNLVLNPESYRKSGNDKSLKRSSYSDDIDKESTQQICVIKGCEEENVNLGVSAFENNLNDQIEIIYGSLLDLIISTDIIVIISHGTEEGIMLNGLIIPWEFLASIINHSEASSIYIAACYSENVKNFNFKSNLEIYCWSGEVDALTMGYYLSFLVNSEFSHVNDALDNQESLKQRAQLIKKHPEKRLPLALFSISYNINPLIVASTIHMKFEGIEDEEFAEDYAKIPKYAAWLISIFAPKEIKEFLKIFVEVISFVYLAQLAIAITESRNHHTNGGCYLSFEVVAWSVIPWVPPAIYIQGRDPDGNILFMLPIITTAFNLLFILTFFSILTGMYYNEPEMQYPSWKYRSMMNDIGMCIIIPIEAEFTVIPCQYMWTWFYLYNQGPFTVIFKPEIEGLPDEYWDINPEAEVPPGQFLMIPIMFHIPCDDPGGIKDISISVSYKDQIKGTSDLKIIVRDIIPPDFDLYEKTIMDNETFDYSVDILASEGASSVTADLYYQNNLVGSDSYPTISDIPNGNSYTFEFVKPALLGDYVISITVLDIFGNSRTKSSIIHYIDDDPNGPEILCTPEIIDITDSHETFSFEVDVSDQSAISSMSVTYNDIVVGSSSGLYSLVSPKELGMHPIYIEAIDDDDDRGEIDRASNLKTLYLMIEDDDITGPEINILYSGSQTDGDPGLWEVVVEDEESGIAEIEVYIDGVLTGHESGYYSVPNSLGSHNIEVFAVNADLDRDELDQEDSTMSHSLIITDDDTTPPELSNLYILDDIPTISISFTALDDNTGDDMGISLISIFVDGELIVSYEPLETETYFEFSLFNQWGMEYGEHTILIEILDADDDREGDSILSSQFGSFIITFEEMKDFLTWEIEQLIVAVIESPDEQWGDPTENRKAAVVNKLTELAILVNSMNFLEAYDKLLHDIKPILTGLKVDETGLEFGNGTFKNAWFTGDNYVDICDLLLTHFQILINF